MNLRLVQIIAETKNVSTFVFDPQKPITWQAGQYLKYTLNHSQPDDRGINRWFTISSAPYKKLPSITTRFTEHTGSTFKKALFALNLGDEIQASGPYGNFVLEDLSKNIVLIAGGIGITPYIAMLEQISNEHKNINGSLLYANRNENYVRKQEIISIANKMPKFEIRYFTSPFKISKTDLANTTNSTNNEVYISGPKPMVESYKNMASELGIIDDNIKLDNFPGYKDI